mgnify:CR=1 FL=1
MITVNSSWLDKECSLRTYIVEWDPNLEGNDEKITYYADRLYDMWRDSEMEDLEEFIDQEGEQLMYKLFDAQED